MSIKTNLLLSSLAVASTLATSNAVAASCQGEIFAMNSGRGETGVVFSLDEQNKSATAHSIAQFSSAAIAYDASTNRTYYASSPIPLEYKVDVSHLDMSDEQFSHLPIRADKFKYSRLAYLDHATGEHVVVGTTKSVIGMTYDASSDSLLAVSFTKLYSIDKNTGEATVLADYSDLDGLSRADLVIKNGELLLITTTSVYSIDRTSFAATELSKHDLIAVGGATVNKNGDLVISRSVINDHGDKNESKLYRLDPYSGETCLAATLPVRINDLTTNTQNAVACDVEPSCSLPSELIPYYSEAVIKQLDSNWKNYDFGDQEFTAPAVFTSAPTFNGKHGGTNRLTDVTPEGYSVSFQEWQYLQDGNGHPNIESFDFLTMDEGRYTMSDGTIVEIGSFILSDTKAFKAVEFSEAFTAKPYVFLQTQTFNGPHTVYTRVAGLNNAGFSAAFYEQDTLNEGHRNERVAYFAILPGSGTTGTLETRAGNKQYSLHQADIDHNGGQIGDHFYLIHEEQSLDAEVVHTKERVQVMDIEEVSLAQSITSRGPDNFSIRRK